MALQPVVKRSVSADVFEQIAANVLSGELAPGSTLPSERQLAEALGVSRPAVREALQRLAAAGLVAVRQGDATTVLDYRRGAGLEILPRLLIREGMLEPAVARSILEVRMHNGPKVAELAAARMGSLDHSGASQSGAPDGDSGDATTREPDAPNGDSDRATTSPSGAPNRNSHHAQATSPSGTSARDSGCATTRHSDTPGDSDNATTRQPDPSDRNSHHAQATSQPGGLDRDTDRAQIAPKAAGAGAAGRTDRAPGKAQSGTETITEFEQVRDDLERVVAALTVETDPVALQRLALEFWDHVVDAADSIVFRLMFNMLRAAYEPALAALAPVMSAEVGNAEGYRELAAAIVAGRPKKAADKARALLEPATTALIEALGGR
ncbi:FCD domain-containing protein [Nocardia bhagyanarayanae]|uniref:FCD domain-containing protein n=1 Tax=Nocardia bhagyanarayanae TaxID=1215925 RepID=A0A543F6T5_9NOCA|nr:FCD domain-containing protein [Nocardia bhagyanarayanae]